MFLRHVNREKMILICGWIFKIHGDPLQLDRCAPFCGMTLKASGKNKFSPEKFPRRLGWLYTKKKEIFGIFQFLDSDYKVKVILGDFTILYWYH